MKILPHDFRNAGKLHSQVELQISRWLGDSCVLFNTEMGRELSFQIETRYVSCGTSRFQTACSDLIDQAAYQLMVGTEQMFTFVSMSQRLALVLVSGLLGESPNEYPTNRLMTPTEQSIYRYLMERWIFSVQERWLSDDRIEINLRELEPDLQRTRMVLPDDNFIRVEFSFNAHFGPEKFYWLFPQERTVEVLQKTLRGSQQPPQDKHERSQLEAMILEMQAELTVRLGTAKLDASALDQLHVGDVLILDQSVRDPLRALVREEEFYRVWAGRVGARRAMQIAAINGQDS